MKSPLRRIMPLGLLVALATPLSGCFDPSQQIFTSENCSGNYCTFTTHGTVRSFGAPPFLAKVKITRISSPGGAEVLVPMVTVPCVCLLECTGDSLPFLLSSGQSGDIVHCGILCGDPVLAEWPNDWFFVSPGWWSHAETGNDGTISALPAALYSLPAGYGPIVTDPGYSARVLSFDLPSMPTQSIYLHFMYRFGLLRAAYVKGIDVVTVQVLETGQRFIVPTGGAGTDFTAMQPPDPRVLLLGPDAPAPTPARKSTWGGLKMLYH